MSAPTIIIAADEMRDRFTSILLPLGFTESRATALAEIFTVNSVDGIYTHGVNRFPRFVQYVKDGYVVPQAVPTLHHKFGAIEQWVGHRGPGALNALHATDAAMRLAHEYGIGCVALANTNHWIRGGTYGWHAAKAGYVFIGMTNTIGVMPAWGALDSRLGNNPFVMALPYQDEAIVLDMAMSQYSFGAMELAVFNDQPLAVYGGYDPEGQLTLIQPLSLPAEELCQSAIGKVPDYHFCWTFYLPYYPLGWPDTKSLKRVSKRIYPRYLSPSNWAGWAIIRLSQKPSNKS